MPTRARQVLLLLELAMLKRLVLEAKSPGSFAAGAVATIASAAKRASAMTSDAGFLSAQVRMGCRYSSLHAGF